MAGSFNQLTLVGYLGKDAEAKYTQSGVSVTRFSVATERSWTNKQSGERQSKTCWHPCVMFGHEGVVQYMTKGKLVLVTAHMESGSYEGKDGQPVYTYEPHVDQVTFLGKANNNGNAEGDGGLKSAPRSAGSQRQAESFDDTVTDDDVPF